MLMSLDQKWGWQSCVLRDTAGGDNSFSGVGQLGLRSLGMIIVTRLVMVYIECAAEVGLLEFIPVTPRPRLPGPPCLF